MRKLCMFASGVAAAAALAGTAIAASPKTHVMNVPLPDGSVARVEYVGDVAPKVMINPGPAVDAGSFASGFPSFAGFDRMIDEMNRRTGEILRQAQEMASNPASAAGAAPYIASFGNLPAGETSTTVVSVSNGGTACTRTTEMVSQGPGKPPKVTTRVSGNCGPGPDAPPPAANRT